MTFNEIRNELYAIRSGEILSPAEESLIPILIEIVNSLDTVHLRIQELALRQMGVDPEDAV